MAEIVGGLLTSAVSGGDRFRVTWRRWGSILPAWTFDPTAVANKVREWLPSAGFIPISNPSAIPGDEVIVFDVRLALSWGGKTIANVLVALENTPVVLSVIRLERIGNTASSEQLERDRNDARIKGNEQANQNAALDAIARTIGITARALATLVLVGAVVVVVYFSRKR